MKVQELLEAQPVVPAEFKEEYDTGLAKKIRAIAKEHGLVAKVTITPLIKDKKFDGVGTLISLKLRGAVDLTVRGMLDKLVAKYEGFWKDLEKQLSEKYNILIPVNRTTSRKFDVSSLETPSYVKLWITFKGSRQTVDPKKMEKHLIEMIRTALEYSLPEYGNSKETLEKKLAAVRKILNGEKKEGREYPEVERRLDPSTFAKTIQETKLREHSQRLRNALKKVPGYFGEGEKKVIPGELHRAIEGIKIARKNGHPMSELEKILPEKMWKEALRSAWSKDIEERIITGLIGKAGSHRFSNDYQYDQAIKDIHRLEKEDGHKFPELTDLLDEKKLPHRFWQVVTKKDAPAEEDVVKYILQTYKKNTHDIGRVEFIIDLAKKAGYKSREIEMIEKSVRANT